MMREIDTLVDNLDTSPQQSTRQQVYLIAIEHIQANPYQPRQSFDTQQLQEMAVSIRKDGVLQPVILTRQNDRYTVVAGERRVRAAKVAGLKSIPAIIRDFTAADMLRVALIENVQRSDLNAIEEATAYHSLITEFGYTHDQCAQKVGKDRSSISNMLRLLALPAEIKTDLIQGRLSMGHCRALLSLSDPDLMQEARQLILKKELSVRQTETLCRHLPNRDRKPSNWHSDMDYLAEGLRDRLKTKVRMSGSDTKGRIEISYFSAAELDRILALIGCKNS